MPSRRTFLTALLASAAVPRLGNPGCEELRRPIGSIERGSLVRRHNPTFSSIDPLSPLSVGNGEFAFTADVTGLQTIAAEYQNAMPLCTMSQWGWHTQPSNVPLKANELHLVQYDTHGRDVGYHTSSEGQLDQYNWLRENPHRLHLGQVGFCRIGTKEKNIKPEDITEIKQELDLWRGILTSNFRLLGQQVKVTTAVHPRLDLLAVSIESELLTSEQLGVLIRFPYGSSSMQAADWGHANEHQTKIIGQTANRLDLLRILDGNEYFVAVATSTPSQLETKLVGENVHSWLLRPKRTSNRLEFVIGFSEKQPGKSLPNADATFSASSQYWSKFWNTGGVVDLEGSKDKRADELERRIVLSQYLTAIQCSGTIPPQETGLTVNSWYGKFHLEMHWWHASHFALWNRLSLFERSLAWYEKILPGARALAKSQGYEGPRWPKMVGPDGRDSPSPIGPLLIWQQPHPIFYAELCYQSHPDRATLERYRDIVLESAAFMASFAFYDQSTKRYVLGPPVIPAQENHPPRETWNPTFELAYWRFGLGVAQAWRERLKLDRSAKWDEVINNLSKLPVGEGVYLAHENCPQTYTERNHDHPSMLAALGVLPGEEVDREIMRRTLRKTMKEWRLDEHWGWDYPMTAMTAARLGETKIAIDALLMSTEKNRYLTNGHNWQRQNLPCYLPGNGGLLYAIALMAAGWRDAPVGSSPGFPADGSWLIRSEGLNSALARKF